MFVIVHLKKKNPTKAPVRKMAGFLIDKNLLVLPSTVSEFKLKSAKQVSEFKFMTSRYTTFANQSNDTGVEKATDTFQLNATRGLMILFKLNLVY